MFQCLYRCLYKCLYRSPIQNREQFQSFCDSLDILMNKINVLNPAISIIIGDFNGKCSKWCSVDSSDNIGKKLDTITWTVWYTQISGLRLLILFMFIRMSTQPAIACSKLTIETLEQGVKYVQS